MNKANDASCQVVSMKYVYNMSNLSPLRHYLCQTRQIEKVHDTYKLTVKLDEKIAQGKKSQLLKIAMLNKILLPTTMFI